MPDELMASQLRIPHLQDIRLIGHWGKFLDAALAFSAHVPERFLFDHSKTDSGTGDTPMMTDKDR